MTINSYYSNILKFAIAVTIPVFVISIVNNHQTKAQTILDSTAATSISNTIDAESSVKSTSVLKQIRADADDVVKKAKNNQEVRYQIGTPVRLGSSTPTKLAEPKNYREREIEDRPRILSSTTPRELNENNKPRLATTPPMTRREGYEDNGKSMIVGIFKEKKAGIVKQLQVALQNIVSLRERIASRIEKERQNGRDMTKAKQLLVVADAKILLAKNAINALRTYSPASTTRVSTTNPVPPPNRVNVSKQIEATTSPIIIDTSVNLVSVNLVEARGLIETAQKSIKDAHKALNDVIVAIAQAMGLKLGNYNDKPASTTPPISPSPTNTN